MISIIDYKMGNLRSVQKAFEHVGAKVRVISSPQEIESADKLVLPGVGAFADGMKYLNDLDLTRALLAYLQSSKPFLGICIGMELLFSISEEDASGPGQSVQGLGVIEGSVVCLEEHRGGQRLKVPHMGWNTIRWNRPDPMFHGLEQDRAVYFVHGYYGQPVDPSWCSAVCDYGGLFCASIWRDSIWATQFHPEKSQRVGLKMLENFAAI